MRKSVRIILTFSIIFFFGCSANVASTPITNISSNALTAETSSTIPAPTSETFTPSPTDASKLPEDLISSIYINDPKCQLPCWWGIALGETRWEEVESFLSGFGAQFRDNGLSAYGEELMIAKVEYHAGSPKVKYQSDQLYFVNSSGIIDAAGIGSVGFGFDKNLSLIEFFGGYGIPDQIWLRTFQNEYAGALPFRAVFFYKEKGALFVLLPQTTWNDQMVTGCFRSASLLNIYYWKVSYGYEFDDVNSRFLNSDAYQKLDDATDTSIESFWMSILNPLDPACITTPKSIWPKQWHILEGMSDQ